MVHTKIEECEPSIWLITVEVQAVCQEKESCSMI